MRKHEIEIFVCVFRTGMKKKLLVKEDEQLEIGIYVSVQGFYVF